MIRISLGRFVVSRWLALSTREPQYFENSNDHCWKFLCWSNFQRCFNNMSNMLQTKIMLKDKSKETAFFKLLILFTKNKLKIYRFFLLLLLVDLLLAYKVYLTNEKSSASLKNLMSSGENTFLNQFSKQLYLNNSQILKTFNTNCTLNKNSILWSFCFLFAKKKTWTRRKLFVVRNWHGIFNE